MANLSTSQFVDELNRMFAEETEAAIRYLHLINAVRGMDRLMVEPILRQAFEETIQHALVIGQKIRTFGAAPQLRVSVDCPGEPLTGKQAVEIALTFEEAALEAYQDMLRKIEGDVVLEEFVRAQITAESQHVAELKELLD
ncbi:MAG: ferritin-like domain-containing protein [Phycisphaerae bacterium]|nr:ferritin-like domain-containing protein [Phycisphaerae bacterium]